ELEKALDRSYTLNERKQLDAVSELFEELDWRESIYAKDLEVFDPEIKLKVPEANKSISDGLWTSKPESELDLLQYIAFLLRRFESPVPEFLASIVDTTKIERELLQRTQSKEIRLWKNRLGNLSQKRIVNPSPQLEMRLKLHGKSLKWEGRKSAEDAFEIISAKDFGQWLAKDYGF